MTDPDQDHKAVRSAAAGQSGDWAAVAASWPSMHRFLDRYRDISKIPDQDKAGNPLQDQRDALAKFYPEHFKNGRSGLWVADPAYVQDRLEKWATLTDRLGNDPALITARRDWSLYDEKQKTAVLKHVAATTLNVLGHEDIEPYIHFDAAGSGGEYAEVQDRKITYYLDMDDEGEILKNSKMFNSFENMTASMVHETFHIDQDELIEAKTESLTSAQKVQRDYLDLAEQNYIRARASDLPSHPERIERDFKLYYLNAKEGEANLALENTGTGGKTDYSGRGWKEIIGNPERSREMSDMMKARASEIRADLQAAIDQGKPYDFVHCRFDQDELKKSQPTVKAFTCSLES